MLSRCCNLTTLPIPFPLSFASLDTHGNGIAESSWLTDYYNNSCRYRLCDDHDARAMFLALEFFFCFFFDQGIGSRSSAVTKHVWWLTYANKSEKRSNGTVVKLAMIKK